MASRILTFDSIVRRYSSGTQHAGRGGAGNTFKEEAKAALEETESKEREQAIVDDELLPPKPKKAWMPFTKKE